MRAMPAVAVLSALAVAGGTPPPPATASDAPPPPRLSAQRLDDRIIVRVDDRPFTTYRFGWARSTRTSTP